MTGAWEPVDLVAPAAAVLVIRGMRRRAVGLAAVALFTLSFPPFVPALFWFSLTPLAILWRFPETLSGRRAAAEGIALGMAMGWSATVFIHHVIPAFGWLFHGIGCFLFSLQIAGMAVAFRLLRHRPAILSALAVGAIALAAESFHARCTPVWWLATLSLPAADTAVIQWARWITPVGVSALVQTVSVLLWPDRLAGSLSARWSGPVIGMFLASGLWSGGLWAERQTPREHLPFSVLLVQPGTRAQEEPLWPILDRLTQNALTRNGPVDLIVWPETCLSPGPLESVPNIPTDEISAPGRLCSPLTFLHHLQPRYGTACLVGAPVTGRTVRRKFGLDISEPVMWNCGCLMEAGRADCHRKTVLVPFMEGLPGWLDTPFVRNRLLPATGMQAPLTCGHTVAPHAFRDRTGRKRTIVISVCYELHCPFSEHFSDKFRAEAIIHLVNDGLFRDCPEFTERQILACRSRAVETRSWNLLCSTLAGTVAVDPGGRIHQVLPSGAGILKIGGSRPDESRYDRNTPSPEVFRTHSCPSAVRESPS